MIKLLFRLSGFIRLLLELKRSSIFILRAITARKTQGRPTSINVGSPQNDSLFSCSFFSPLLSRKDFRMSSLKLRSGGFSCHQSNFFSLKSLKSLARSSLRTDQESPGHPITRNSSQGSLGNDLLMAIQGCALCEGVRATEVREGWWWSTVQAH